MWPRFFCIISSQTVQPHTYLHTVQQKTYYTVANIEVNVEKKISLNVYRPSSTVRLMSFMDDSVLSLVFPGLEHLRGKYTGCFGSGSGVVSFSSMNNSWHERPTVWTVLNTQKSYMDTAWNLMEGTILHNSWVHQILYFPIFLQVPGLTRCTT